jgi:phosphoribosylamine--glycine ligase
MKILVVGGGGREHALVWKLSQSPRVDKIYCAPGNAGIASLAECVPVGAEDIDGRIALAVDIPADLVVVGPEAPLAKAWWDRLTARGIRACGPRPWPPGSKAARLRQGPDAQVRHSHRHYAVFEDYEAARDYVAARNQPWY